MDIHKVPRKWPKAAEHLRVVERYDDVLRVKAKYGQGEEALAVGQDGVQKLQHHIEGVLRLACHLPHTNWQTLQIMKKHAK